MQKFDVQIALEGVREARGLWSKAMRKFQSDVEKVMTRLLHEAAANFMSVEEVARHSGMSPKRVRSMMREAGLNPRDGKTLLSKQAAEALASNADLLGIAPHEMDLMSPLAYLPAGSELRQQITDKSVSGVTELADYQYGDARQLAFKLEDAGPMPDEAIAWVNEVIARNEQIPVSGNNQ